jgi:hypothetical protein
VSGEVDLAHGMKREGGEVGAGVEAVVRGRDEDVVDVEQQPAAGAAGDLGEEVGLGPGRGGEGHVGGRVLEEHPPPERLLHRVHMVADEAKGLVGVGERQEVVEPGRAVARPGEVLGEAVGLVAVDQRLQPREVIAGPARPRRRSTGRRRGWTAHDPRGAG